MMFRMRRSVERVRGCHGVKRMSWQCLGTASNRAARAATVNVVKVDTWVLSISSPIDSEPDGVPARGGRCARPPG